MAEELKKRSEVDEKLTWDLKSIYPSREMMYKDMNQFLSLAEKIEKKYKGNLTLAKTIVECLDEYREVMRIMYLVRDYTELSLSVDFTDARLTEDNAKAARNIAKASSQLSFIESEILMQKDEIIEEAGRLSKESECFLKDLLRKKEHQLHPEAEKVMAQLSSAINLPYEVYNVVKLADIQFDDFEVDGKKYPLGYAMFEDDYEYDERTNIRRAAFAAFSKKIKEYQNVTATAYNAQVQNEKMIASLRGFDSVFDYLLFGQKVTREMYDRQIDTIMEKLSVHMRKYARLIKKVHGLDKVTFADLKLPIDPEYDPKVSIKEAKEYISKGLSIMGEDYVDMIKEAFDKRWVDFAQNVGKSTGGFCASPYGTNSFILMTWNDRMSDVFTLSHELGHCGHFASCNEKQSIFDIDVSMYFIEAPSTINELLMAHYLLKTNQDKRFRRWVLSSMISNTYYHNFVTHFMEAAYQRKVLSLVDEGKNLSADDLSGIMKEMLTKFWGEDVEIIDGAELTWMRQPHYYMGLYSYTYSAGLTVATQVCKRIENEGENAIKDWKKVLAAGSTRNPVELAALAGIDITTSEPLLDTIETIGQIVDEICEYDDVK